MKTLSKALVGTVAAGAMAMASATPAFARDRDNDHDGIGVGEIIAGAVIIGGIAAVAGAIGNDRNRGTYGEPYNGRYDDRYSNRYDDRYSNRYDNRYARRGDSRQAVQQCINAAERDASRYSHGRAKVTDIRDIKRSRDGYRVKGRIAVNQNNRGYRGDDRRYGNGWDNDYRGVSNNYRGYDAGKFTCEVRYGRVVDIHYSGVRGLR